MGFKIVVLWSDVVVIATLLMLIAYAWRIHGSVNLRATWLKVLRDPAAICSSVVLVLFFAVAVVDSLHFRVALASAAGRSDTGRIPSSRTGTVVGPTLP